MDFYTLDSSDIAQYNKWVDIWQNWNSREIFAHPDYVRMFLRDADKAICAVQESPEGFILLPMILRPLSVESWTDKQNSYYDAITPYGYGGPYTEGCADIDFFWLQVQRWAAENHIISIFFRFSPVAVIISGFMGKVESCGDVIIRSLTEGKEAVWNDYKHAVRTCIRCAAQHGLTIEIS